MSIEFENIKIKNENRKLKTNLVRIEALRIKQYDDAYPDVGMGMSWQMCVEQAFKSLGIDKKDVDFDKLVW